MRWSDLKKAGAWGAILGVSAMGVFSTTAMAATVKPLRLPAGTLIVNPQGSHGYNNIQAAVNAAVKSGRRHVLIVVRPGVYHQRVVIPRRAPAITLLGEDGRTRRTILTWSLNANAKGPGGKPVGTFATQVLWVRSNNFAAANLSIVNSAGNTGQAVAVRVDGDRNIFYHCNFLSWQDTLLTTHHRQYFENCNIYGATDFIFGGATSYFNNCRIHCLGYGFITAARTPKNQKYGYIFNHCKITSLSRPGRVVLGRPWRQYADVVFMRCWIPRAVRARGWITWHHNPVDQRTTRYAEFDNVGPGGGLGHRVSWSRHLTAQQAERLTVERVLGGSDQWDPQAIIQQQILPQILTLALPKFAPQKFTITQFGARSGGKILDTHAIERTIRICAAAGGGTVIIPKGTYLTGALKLLSNVNLHLDTGATLLMSTNPADYVRTASGYDGCIQADQATNIAITGHGVINGDGHPWWEIAWRAKMDAKHAVPTPVPVRRPQLVVLNECRHVLISGVTLENSPSFHLFPQECRDVIIRGITILAPKNSPNTDGIDPSGWNYLISHCMFNEGDDCIAIKAAGRHGFIRRSCANFLIRNNIFDHGHGMSVGSVTYGGLRNMTVTDCTFDHTDAGIRLKSNRRRGGPVSDLYYSNLKMADVKVPIQIVSYYLKIPRRPQLDKARPITRTTPIWRHITIENVTAVGARVDGMIIGLPEMPVSDVRIIHTQISGHGAFKIVNAVGVKFIHSSVHAQQHPVFDIHDASVVGIGRSR